MKNIGLNSSIQMQLMALRLMPIPVILICLAVLEYYLMNISPGSFIKQCIEFDCPICLEAYDDNNKYPMMLCLSQHSCCLKCVNSLFAKSEQSECPFCKTHIAKKDVKKFRLLHEIKETAKKLRNKTGNQMSSGQNVQQLQDQLAKEREKNSWLIQQMKEREGLWIGKLKNGSLEEDQLKAELMMKRFQVQHMKAVIHDQNDRLVHQFIKENTLLSQNIKMKINQKEEHLSGRFKFQHFEIIRKLGKGDYSMVYLARQKRVGFLCALKAIEKWKVKQLNLEQAVIRQIKATSFFEHPNIIKTYGYFSDEKCIYTIGELAIDETLTKSLKKGNKCNVPAIVRQTVLGIRQLCANSIVHNEISSDTIVLTFNDVVKISGFGWITILTQKGSSKDKQSDYQSFYKDIRSAAAVCFQALHPDRYNISKSPQLWKQMNEEIKNAFPGSALDLIALAIGKSQHPIRLISELLAHPFLNDK